MKVYIARRTRRVPTNWPGRYLAPPSEDWAECRIANLSMGGAALEVAVPSTEPQGRLTLALYDQDGQPLGLELQAEVLWWDTGADPDRLRIGVQFVDVAPADFSTPLRLLAHTLEFPDPLTGRIRKFSTRRRLL